MNTLKIGQHCPAHKGIYAGVARSFSSEPDNHIWLLDAKSPNELMNWTDATEWAESLGEDTSLPTRYEAALLGCNLAEELGDYGYVWTSTSEGVRSAWLQLWYSSRPNSQGTAGKTNTLHVRAVKRLPVTYEMKGHPLAAPAQAVPASVIMASVMRDDGGVLPAFCLMVAYRAEKDAMTALAMLTDEPAQQAAPDMTDAYAGAREDLSIWKKRALEAEALNRKFAASVNSPSFMGEPAALAQAGEYPPLVCDYCGALTPDPWHSSGMLHGKMSKHIHSCDACEALEATQASPVDAAVQQDAERYRWLREYAIGAYTTVQGKGSTVIYLLTKAPALDGIGEETDTAIDAARATQEGKHD